MKLRRVAISVAATTALALGAAAPASAEHEVPELLPGNPTCDDVAEEFGIEGLVSLHKKEYNEPQPATVDVDADDFEGYEILVIVKGGPKAHVFFEPPFHDLYAPDNRGGKQADISHYEVCGVKAKDPDPKDPDPKDPDPKDPDPKDPDPKDPDPKDPDPKDPEPKDPEPEKTPVAVPTAVPAGHGDTGSGVAVTVGLIAALAALTAAAAAGAMLIRRRFGHES